MLEKIEDIKKALKAKAYLSALALTLTLPDICAKLEFKKFKKDKTKYSKWFNKYFIFFQNKVQDEFPKLNGKECYRLRCAFLHSGNSGNTKDKKVNKFKLVIGGTYSEEICKINDIITKKVLTIDVKQFCELICNAVEKFYNENKEKYNFKEHNIEIKIQNLK